MADWKQDGKQTGREGTRAIIQTDRMLQIALILPAAVFVGWLIGMGLDEWLHTHWIYMVGIFVGLGAGIMQILRLLKEMEQKMTAKRAAGDETGGGDGRIDEEPK